MLINYERKRKSARERESLMPDEIESSGNCVPMQSKARERELKKKGWK